MEKNIGHPVTDFGMVDIRDKRLNNRLIQSIENFTNNTEESILGAGKKRSDAKAFYRLLSNDKFELEKLSEAAKPGTIS